MRPKSIRLFDILYVGGVVLGLVNFALGMTVLRPAGSPPLSEQVAEGSLPVVGSNILGAVIALTLWYLVSHLRIGVLRWVLAALVIVGAASIPGVLAMGMTPSTGLLLLASIMQVAALWFLFRPDARAWFVAAREA